MTSSGRMDWVDLAKGLSIILVVMMYAAYNTGEYTGQAGVLHYAIGFATPFRMPEFFLISGLFLSNAIDRPWRKYVDRRIIHYLYFYAVWAFIMIALKVGLYELDPWEMLTSLSRAVAEPYGVLWFIYMLAAFGAVVRLLRGMWIPKWATILVAGFLHFRGTQVEWTTAGLFSIYFVYFYAGYWGAPWIFRLVSWSSGHAKIAMVGVATWALANGLLVFSAGHIVMPTRMQMGIASSPAVHFALAISGALALCVTGGLLTKVTHMGWLRWLGEHSLVIYVSFTIPMSLFRAFALHTGIITDTSLLSVAVLLVSLLGPFILYKMVEFCGKGLFLFERPVWAYICDIEPSSEKAPLVRSGDRPTRTRTISPL